MAASGRLRLEAVDRRLHTVGDDIEIHRLHVAISQQYHAIDDARRYVAGDRVADNVRRNVR